MDEGGELNDKGGNDAQKSMISKIEISEVDRIDSIMSEKPTPNAENQEYLFDFVGFSALLCYNTLRILYSNKVDRV